MPPLREDGSVTDTPYRWVPPGLDEEEVEKFLTVKTGVPDSARDALTGWLTSDKHSSDLLFVRNLIEFQTASGIDLGVGGRSAMSVRDLRASYRKLPEQTLVYLLDFTISAYRAAPNKNYTPDRVKSLGRILHSAGSSWTIGERQGRYALAKRVPDGVADVVDQVLSNGDKASSMLIRAWEQAYGISPSPSGAYQDAVKAVEIVANPLISPKDESATLGKDINVLRGQKDKWQFVMAGSSHTSAVEHVISTMQLLWHSQSDRHGSADYVDVTVAEAQAAVLLASTLVGWLSQDALKKIA